MRLHALPVEVAVAFACRAGSGLRGAMPSGSEKRKKAAANYAAASPEEKVPRPGSGNGGPPKVCVARRRKDATG